MIIKIEPHWAVMPLLPAEKLLTAISGEDGARWQFYERPRFLKEINGVSLLDAMMPLLEQLTERERFILVSRFGLDGQLPKSLQGIIDQGISATRVDERQQGKYGSFIISKERIRQIEAKALRKLRNPRRTLIARQYIRKYTVMEDRTALARSDLYIAMLTMVPALSEQQAKDYARRVTRSNLARALKAANSADLRTLNDALVQSCKVFLEPTTCLLCDQPGLPGVDWCIEHIRQLRKPKQIVFACSHCGAKHLRLASQIIPHGHSFCNWECFMASRVLQNSRKGKTRVKGK